MGGSRSLHLPRKHYLIGRFKARLALSSIADTASKFDEDGIDIHFINSKKEGLNVKVGHNPVLLSAGVYNSVSINRVAVK